LEDAIAASLNVALPLFEALEGLADEAPRRLYAYPSQTHFKRLV
jgi:hypothetical protein